jgi:hypothetical protein
VEVAAALPGKTFSFFADGTLARFTFPIALTAPEQSTLDSTVAAHKAPTGPSPFDNQEFWDFHEPTHEKDGIDELPIQNLGTGAADSGQLVETDGAGGLTLVGAGTVGGGADHASQFDGSSFVTSSAAFVDALTAHPLAPTAGDYLSILETESQGSNSATIVEIAVALNSTTVAVVDSERSLEGDDIQNIVSTMVLTGLTPTDYVTMLVRKSSGPGSVTLTNRRLTIVRIK